MHQLFFMIRINHFHELQSMIGSERAGAIQRQVFNVVRSVCRSSDKVLPCHRDECGAIAWVSDPDDGSLLADRIQERVRSQVFDAGDDARTRYRIAPDLFDRLLREPGAGG